MIVTKCTAITVRYGIGMRQNTQFIGFICLQTRQRLAVLYIPQSHLYRHHHTFLLLSPVDNKCAALRFLINRIKTHNLYPVTKFH